MVQFHSPNEPSSAEPDCSCGARYERAKPELPDWEPVVTEVSDGHPYRGEVLSSYRVADPIPECPCLALAPDTMFQVLCDKPGYEFEALNFHYPFDDAPRCWMAHTPHCIDLRMKNPHLIKIVAHGSDGCDGHWWVWRQRKTFWQKIWMWIVEKFWR